MNRHDNVEFDEWDREQTDRQLRRLFADATQPMSSAGFEQQFMLRLQRAQRVRRGWTLVALFAGLMAAACLVAPLMNAVLWTSAWLTQFTLNLGEWFTTDIGMLASLAAAAWVLMKAHVFGRS